MQQKIIDFEQDQHQDWCVKLSCGHYQHMRHHPPWQNRPWVISQETRQTKIGLELDCLLCDEELI